MHLYLLVPQLDNNSRAIVEKVKAVALDCKMVLTSRIEQKTSLGLNEYEIRSMRARGETFIEQVDAVIVEGSSPSIDVHYLLAEAMCFHKPALCLTSFGSHPDELFECLQHPNLPSWIQSQSYREQEIDGRLTAFFKFCESFHERVTRENVSVFPTTLDARGE